MASIRICLAIAFAVLAVSVHASDFTEDAEDTVMLQAKASVAALKKKGATNADCVDLANTMCKTVEKEQNTDQKLMDRLKDGRQCVNLGLTQVIKATAHLKKTRAVHAKMEVNVRSSHNAKVHMGVHRFSSLKQGKCGQFFTSRAYRVAHHRYTRNVKIAADWSGRVKESSKTLVNAKHSRARQVKRCHCETRKARNTMWRTVSNRSRVARQIKAHQKCKMMACVLKGTSLRNRSCRASLKRVRTKKLIKATENVRGCSSKPSFKKCATGPARIRYQTGHVSRKPNKSNFARVVNAAVARKRRGYCSKNLSSMGAVANKDACRGSKRNIAYKYAVSFEVGTAGTYKFDFNVDFGWGGVVEIDGKHAKYYGRDMWWAGSKNRANQLNVSRHLKAGRHTIKVYGAEGCCDGSSNVKVMLPRTRHWQTLSVAALKCK